jgi:hypothetical protein
MPAVRLWQQSLDGVLQWMRTEFRPASAVATEDRSGRERVFRVQQGSPSPTLLIANAVLQRHSAAEITAALDRLHVAARLRSDPMTRLRCVEQAGNIVILQPLRWQRPTIPWIVTFRHPEARGSGRDA